MVKRPHGVGHIMEQVDQINEPTLYDSFKEPPLVKCHVHFSAT
jgi:hypothetical protein